MTRKNPPMQWVLPEVVNPAGRLCYSVPVPDDRQHIAAFMGAIFSLSKAYNWQNDPDHIALQAASVWKNIYDTVSMQTPSGECGGLFPFFCPGDARSNSQPFGIWTPGCVGHFVGSTAGYHSDEDVCGSSTYEGVDLYIGLANPATISNVRMVFDMERDFAKPGIGYYMIFVYDVTNAVFVGTPIFGDDTVNGTDLTYDTGPFSAPCSEFRVFVASGADASAFASTGHTNLLEVDVTGDATSPPC